jgi:hypothetical protein
VDAGDVLDAQGVLDVRDAVKGSLRIQERGMVVL